MIGGHIIFGANPEPFLEAALRSVQWLDYICAVNTAPEDPVGQLNEAIFRQIVPAEKQRYRPLQMAQMDFAKARNACLDLADPGDYVLKFDADDVHYPELEDLARAWAAQGRELVEGAFWHLIAYKDLLGEEHPRKFFFRNVYGIRFDGAVHEELASSFLKRIGIATTQYRWVHYGYVKAPREIFKRWQLYAVLEGEPGRYEGRNPDDILDDWLGNCAIFWHEHPPAVQSMLESYPAAPRSAKQLDAPRNVGLVMLTWDDAENLERCLETLTYTRQPFKLAVVDNGSTDRTFELLNNFTDTRLVDGYGGPEGDMLFWPSAGRSYSLVQALNIGFGHFMKDPEIDYVGWIHPDMVFEYPTWLECLRHCLDIHPDIAKVGALDLNASDHTEPVEGNSQCYLVRKSALEQVGLFDEGFLACGGYEDWEHNFRLTKVGRVMIWPDAKIRHYSMSTRRRHDNVEAAQRNADRYYQLTGTRDPVV